MFLELQRGQDSSNRRQSSGEAGDKVREIRASELLKIKGPSEEVCVLYPHQFKRYICPALWRERQADLCELESSLFYVERPVSIKLLQTSAYPYIFTYTHKYLHIYTCTCSVRGRAGEYKPLKFMSINNIVNLYLVYLGTRLQ